MQYSRWGFTNTECGVAGSLAMTCLPWLFLFIYLFLMHARIQLAFWAVRAHCWLVSSFPSTTTPGPFWQGCTLPLHPLAWPDSGVPLPRCKTLHLTLLNLLRFSWTHCSSLLRTLWMSFWPSSMSTAPHSLVTPGNLLRVLSIRALISVLTPERHRSSLISSQTLRHWPPLWVQNCHQIVTHWAVLFVLLVFCCCSLVCFSFLAMTCIYMSWLRSIPSNQKTK